MIICYDVLRFHSFQLALRFAKHPSASFYAMAAGFRKLRSGFDLFFEDTGRVKEPQMVADKMWIYRAQFLPESLIMKL